MAIKKDEVDAVLVGFGWTAPSWARANRGRPACWRWSAAPCRTPPRKRNIPRCWTRAGVFGARQAVPDLSKETVTSGMAWTTWRCLIARMARSCWAPAWAARAFADGMHYRVLPEELKLAPATKPLRQELHPRRHDHPGLRRDPMTNWSLFHQVRIRVRHLGQGRQPRWQDRRGRQPAGRQAQQEYPLPPLTAPTARSCSRRPRAKWAHPVSGPRVANASAPYTNPYGVRLGPCNFCGFCENYGCYMYSKASPQTTILPVLLKSPTLNCAPIRT